MHTPKSDLPVARSKSLSEPLAFQQKPSAGSSSEKIQWRRRTQQGASFVIMSPRSYHNGVPRVEKHNQYRQANVREVFYPSSFSCLRML